MAQSLKIFAALVVLVSAIACADEISDFDAQRIADEYSSAVNRKDLNAVLSHWSEDALLVFLPGSDDHTIAGLSGLQYFYEDVFSSDHHEKMTIIVAGVEAMGDLVREWGSYKIGREVSGCYVILRRKSDGWKIFREWLVEPCGE